MKPLRLQLTLLAIAIAALAQSAQANIIPYPNIGTENPDTYSFTATANGDIVGYFAAKTSASYTEAVALMVNGVFTGNGFGLNNHSSVVGQSFDFGAVHAGDTLTFVLSVINPPYSPPYIYSDSALNAPYDGTLTGHNHVYSVAYDSSTHLLDPSVPSGTYVAFEDLPAPSADFNYADDTFVFQNTTVSVVPEAKTTLAGLLLLLPLGASALRTVRKTRAA